MGFLDLFFRTNSARNANSAQMKLLREPKSKYYRLVQAIAGLVLGLTAVVFLLSFFVPVLKDHFNFVLKAALVIAALCIGAFVCLPWIYFLERNKKLEGEGKPAPKWQTYVCYGFIGVIAFAVLLWVIAVFVVHVSTFTVLLQSIADKSGIVDEDGDGALAKGALASLNFLAAAIIITLQVLCASNITASVIRYGEKHKAVRIINYVALILSDLWVSWILGCLFTGNVYSASVVDGKEVWTLMAPVNPKKLWLVFGIIACVATLISGTILTTRVRRDRMRAALKGDTGALSATEEDFIQGTYKDASATPDAPAPMPASAASSEKTPAERMRELKQLFDDGVITQEEYEAKRRELLDKM